MSESELTNDVEKGQLRSESLAICCLHREKLAHFCIEAAHCQAFHVRSYQLGHAHASKAPWHQL